MSRKQSILAVAKTLAYGFFALISIPFMLWGGVQTDYGKSFVVSFMEETLGTDDLQLHIGKLDGNLPMEWIFSDIQVSDPKGKVVSVDRLHVLWQPVALLSGTLLIDDISMGRINLYKTLSAGAPKKVSSEKSSSLPANFSQGKAFLLKNLSVDHIHMEPAVLGFPVDASLKSRTELQSIQQGLLLDLDLVRIDEVAGMLKAEVLFKPLQEIIQLSLEVHEPAKGIVVHLLKLPGLPEFNASLKGEGGMKDWQGKLNLNAGEGVVVDGKIGVAFRGETGLDLDLNMESHVPAFLPADFNPLLSDNKIRAKASLEYPDQLKLKTFKLSANGGRLDLSGSIGIEAQQVDLLYAIAPNDAKLFTAWSQGALWKALNVNGTLKGTMASPKLEATLKMENLQYQDYAIQRVSEKLKVYPAPSSKAQNIQWVLESSASLQGITGSDANINHLTEKVDWNILGQLDSEQGQFKITSSEVLIPAGKLEVRGEVSNWGENINLRNEISIPDLNAFSPWVSAPLGGELAVSVKTDVLNKGQQVNLELKGVVNDIHTGVDLADRVAGKHVNFSGNFSKEESGVLKTDRWQISGASLAVNGKQGYLGTDGKMEMEASVKLTRLEDFFTDPAAPVKGAMDINILASGSLSDPKVDAKFVSEKLMLQDMDAKQLKWSLHAQNLLGSPQGNTAGKVILGTIPVELSTHFLMNPNTSLQLKNLHLTGLETDVKGDLELDLQSKRVKGKVTGVLKDSLSLAQWTGQAISGRWEFLVGLDPANGQSVSVSAQGSNIQMKDPGGWQMASASITGKVADVMKDQKFQAQLSAQNIVLQKGKTNIADVKANVEGDLSHINWGLTAKGQAPTTFNLASKGNFEQKDLDRKIQVSLLQGDYGPVPFKMLEPFALLLTPEKKSIENIKFQISDGELSGNIAFMESASDTQGDVKLVIRKIPLDLARLVAPDVKVLGRVDGDIFLSGSLQNPVGQFYLKAYEVDLENKGELNLKQGSYEIRGEWKNNQASLNAQLAQSMLGTLALTAVLPLKWDFISKSLLIPEDQPLAGKAEGVMELKVWNDYLSAGGEMVDGKINLQASFAGLKKNPKISGKLFLTDGRYENMGSGTVMHPITFSLLAEDTEVIRIENFEAITPNKGSIKGSGSLQFISSDSYGFNVDAKASNAQLVGLDALTAIASGNLNIKGDQDSMKVSGKIEIDKADIRLPDRLPTQVVLLDYVDADAEMTIGKNDEEKKKNKINPALDIQISANNRVYIRGSGLDAELQGECIITGTAEDPKVNGKLKLKQGTLDLLGRHLVFSRGIVDLTGAPKVPPTLDFQADIRDKDITFHTLVKGSVDKPEIQIKSSPELPQEEVLSQLLFGKNSSSLSPLEAIQLVDAAAQFVGVDSGSKQVLSDLKNSLGLDKFNINSNNPDGTAQVEAGHYLADNVYVGVKENMASGESSAVVQMEVTPNINLESDFSGNQSRLGINMEWDY
ncbi:MAG: hypothetical protein COV66_05175 [Nitrospinae bacterium CG11_big_fil_rev_8_21_14_0_20_45_15]|nr:MAG: hypothetical protein COV66_05175 [Nitrospinae bacterium CG11_big_fil_rev_8_21_14_0_20_45_15]